MDANYHFQLAAVSSVAAKAAENVGDLWYAQKSRERAIFHLAKGFEALALTAKLDSLRLPLQQHSSKGKFE